MTPYLLLIETSTLPFSIALSEGKKILAFYEETEGKSLAANITLAIEKVLQNAETELVSLDGVVVSLGPGSYTGLRIGLSVAKGLCFALNIPLITIETTLSMAHQVNHTSSVEDGTLILPMVDARRQEIYTAAYDNQLVQVIPLQSMIFPLTEEIPSIQQAKKIILCGDGAMKSISYFPSQLVSISPVKQNAQNLAIPGFELYEQEKFTPIVSAVPIYLKPPNITQSIKLEKLLRKP
jgi:tRNA threonylcarbamoyladenosine biosynthesis protein TsaB